MLFSVLNLDSRLTYIKQMDSITYKHYKLHHLKHSEKNTQDRCIETELIQEIQVFPTLLDTCYLSLHACNNELNLKVFKDIRTQLRVKIRAKFNFHYTMHIATHRHVNTSIIFGLALSQTRSTRTRWLEKWCYIHRLTSKKQLSLHEHWKESCY